MPFQGSAATLPDTEMLTNSEVLHTSLFQSVYRAQYPAFPSWFQRLVGGMESSHPLVTWPFLDQSQSQANEGPHSKPPY